MVDGDKVVATLEGLAQNETIEAVIAAGGDGTISTAAALALKGNKVLGIFHIKGIPSSGGISTPDKGLISTTEHYPSLEACRAAGTST